MLTALPGDSIWSAVCGESSFQLWNSDIHYLDVCVEKVICVPLVYTIASIVTAFYLGWSGTTFVRDNYGKFKTDARIIFSLGISLLQLVIILWRYLYHESDLLIIDIGLGVLQFSYWFLHALYLRKLRKSISPNANGPSVVIITWVATSLISLEKLGRVIVNHHYGNSSFSYEFVITFLEIILQVSYFVVLFIPSHSEYEEGISYNNEEDQSLLTKSVDPYAGFHEDNSNDLGVAEENANIISKLTFFWVIPLLKKGLKFKIESIDDLFELPHSMRVSYLEKKFKNNYEWCHDAGVRSERAPILKSLIKSFGYEYFSLGIIKLLADSFTFVGPLILNVLIKFVEDRNEPMKFGYVYSVCLLMSSLICAFLNSHFLYAVDKVVLKIRASLIDLIYQKFLLVSYENVSSLSSGEVLNSMSVDIERIVSFCPNFHAFWSLPFQFAVTVYLLYQQVGISFLAGIIISLLFIPMNRYLALKISKFSQKMMEFKDRRVDLISEILLGIRVVKFYSWEKYFLNNIETMRSGELKYLKKRKYLDAVSVCFWATATILISLATFTTYVLLGNKLTAARCFTCISLFGLLVNPLNSFPWVINSLIEAWISLKRVRKILMLPEIKYHEYYELLPFLDQEKVALKFDNSYFCWSGELKEEINVRESSKETFIATLSCNSRDKSSFLSSLNIQINKGDFVGLVGQVGSGKSSFLYACMGEMRKTGGIIFIDDFNTKFGYIGPEPWIQHATIRENILFGSPFDSEMYTHILQVCCLNEDLKIFPKGDLTVVGDNGVTLSGGQKARVALARAVYQDTDIYLIDDVLSAVDAYVGSHIFHNVIMDHLKNKTRVFATHSTRYLLEADKILLFDNGTIISEGAPKVVLQNIDISKFNPVMSKAEAAVDISDSYLNSEVLDDDEEEIKFLGKINSSVFKFYFLSVGKVLTFGIFLSLTLMQATRNFSDWWLAHWVSGKTPYNHTLHFFSEMSLSGYYAMDQTTYYLVTYGMIAVSNSIFTLFRAFLFAYGGILAARRIHEKLINTVMKATVQFFDVTPIGQIINRLSSDLYSIDDSLPFIFNIFLAQFFAVLGAITLTSIGLPWILVIVIPLMVLYYFIQNYYRHTSRELKRLSSITRSPIYAHFSETISGLVTIRALKNQRKFIEKNESILENNLKVQLCEMAVGQWLSLHLQYIGVIIIFSVSLLCIIEHQMQTIEAGLVGLAVAYALSLTNLLSGTVATYTDTEKEMVSVERAHQYISEIPQEKYDGVLNAPFGWPYHGIIHFKEVDFRYRKELPRALSGVTFITRPAEKVGIVGRTGSGKSSLFLALFRMFEIDGGEIQIDNINVKLLDLSYLRSHIAIIPQDPFLFAGTVAENLDPNASHTPEEIWTALEKCHLSYKIHQLGGLSSKISERGRCLSSGQRQLFCLARALLSNAKILCIDEATSNLDVQTDDLIQITIRTVFRHNTVLTIAHRIRTIMDSDRVLVLGEGQVIEFDSPQKLMENETSYFRQLVH